MAISLRVASVLVVLALCGCDTVSGVRRSVTVHKLPPPAVVTAALEAVPGITTVQRIPGKASTSGSLYHGVVHEPAYDQFLYRTDSLFGLVITRETGEGVKEIELNALWMNYVPPRKTFDETRTLLDQVYSSMRRHSPDLPPATQIKEILIRPPHG